MALSMKQPKPTLSLDVICSVRLPSNLLVMCPFSDLSCDFLVMQVEVCVFLFDIMLSNEESLAPFCNFTILVQRVCYCV